jgi:hypothetical protein
MARMTNSGNVIRENLMTGHADIVSEIWIGLPHVIKTPSGWLIASKADMWDEHVLRIIDPWSVERRGGSVGVAVGNLL